MDIDGLVRAAVDTVARHLAQRGTDAAGRLVNAAVDRVYQLIVSRLRRSREGRQALDQLHRDPADPRARAHAADLVSEQAHADRRFAHQLDDTSRQAGITVHFRIGDDQRIGNVRAGRDVRIKQKQFHIGRIQFGMGGLVSGIAVLVVVLGGGTAAVVGATAEEVSLSSAIGRWERPGEAPAPGIETGPAVLDVNADGAFTFAMEVRMSAPAGTPAIEVPGFPNLSLNCAGTVEPAGDHYTLRSSAGQCGTFDAKLSSDGRMIDLFLSNESSTGSLSLTKAG